MLEKILSGGQDGADVAGWRAAKSAGLRTGGTMPRGFVTVGGPRPEYAALYGAEEAENTDYAHRTQQNVADAQGTVLFVLGREGYNTPGSRCCRKWSGIYDRPVMVVDLARPLLAAHALAVADEIVTGDISVLNVAGNRAAPEHQVESFLLDVFGLLQQKGFLRLEGGRA